jgi:hypothetical protein
MKRIAVIGENSNDTAPLCKVWNKEFSKKAKFVIVLPSIVGDQWEADKAFRLLRAELGSQKFNGIIAIRDLDGPRSSKTALSKRQNWFKKISTIAGRSAFLLNVQEIEAMHFADLDPFNKAYKTTIVFKGNPEAKASPKDELMRLTSKKFKESDNKVLIPKLDFTKVKAKCQFYRDFVADLELLLKK